MNKRNELNFDSLISAIRQVHEHLAAQAGKAVNISLTLRNWLVGCYIREYEQNGSDRAYYGEKLLERLAESLKEQGLERMEPRELRRYRQFYQVYPQIRETVTPKLHNLLPVRALSKTGIRGTVTPELSFSGKKTSYTAIFQPSCRTDNHHRLAQTRFLRNRVYPWKLVCAGTETPDRKSLL